MQSLRVHVQCDGKAEQDYPLGFPYALRWQWPQPTPFVFRIIESTNGPNRVIIIGPGGLQKPTLLSQAEWPNSTVWAFNGPKAFEGKCCKIGEWNIAEISWCLGNNGIPISYFLVVVQHHKTGAWRAFVFEGEDAQIEPPTAQGIRIRIDRACRSTRGHVVSESTPYLIKEEQGRILLAMESTTLEKLY